MPTFHFQWQDKNGHTRRRTYSGYEEVEAWYRAFRDCGWDQRTTLGIIGNDDARQIRDGIIKNWWNAMDDENLYEFNRLYLSFNLQDQLRSGFKKIVDIYTPKEKEKTT